MEARFWSKTETCESGCIRWIGRCNDKGYGWFDVREKDRYRGRLAHRVAWEFAHGPVPDGKYVLHRCDFPACVNHEHLFLGTQKDNIRDMDAKGRRGDLAVHGERNGRARLTSSIVESLRERHQGGETFTHLASEYGVSPSTISRAVTGKRWASITEARKRDIPVEVVWCGKVPA